MRDAIFTSDQLKILQDFLPTREESLTLSNYKGITTQLDRVDKYMLLMLSLPSAHAKISCMLFRLNHRNKLVRDLFIFRNLVRIIILQFANSWSTGGYAIRNIHHRASLWRCQEFRATAESASNDPSCGQPDEWRRKGTTSCLPKMVEMVIQYLIGWVLRRFATETAWYQSVGFEDIATSVCSDYDS